MISIVARSRLQVYLYSSQSLMASALYLRVVLMSYMLIASLFIRFR